MALDTQGHYANIRDFLGMIIGQKVLDVTQHDEDADLSDECGTFVELSFDNGYAVRFFTRPAQVGPCFMIEHPDGCGCHFCFENEGEGNE